MLLALLILTPEEPSELLLLFELLVLQLLPLLIGVQGILLLIGKMLARLHSVFVFFYFKEKRINKIPTCVTMLLRIIMHRTDAIRKAREKGKLRISSF